MKKLSFNERGYLIPNEPIEADLETFEKYFVTAFPGSTTRRKLFENYLRFVYRMQDEVFPFFEQWIDGSFVTMKENPNDIDVVTFIDYRVWNTRSEKKMDEFWGFSLEREGIDSYLVKEFPKEHPEYLRYLNLRRNKNNLYGNTRLNELGLKDPKGFLRLIFEKQH